MTHPDAIFAFFTEIGILAQLSQTQFERLMPAGMTLAQFTVLNHCVRVSDGKSPATLARAFQVTKATMTSTLQRLEQKGSSRSMPTPGWSLEDRATLPKPAGPCGKPASLQRAPGPKT